MFAKVGGCAFEPLWVVPEVPESAVTGLAQERAVASGAVTVVKVRGVPVAVRVEERDSVPADGAASALVCEESFSVGCADPVGADEVVPAPDQLVPVGSGTAAAVAASDCLAGFEGRATFPALVPGKTSGTFERAVTGLVEPPLVTELEPLSALVDPPSAPTDAPDCVRLVPLDAESASALAVVVPSCPHEDRLPRNRLTLAVDGPT
jgi:hypothetical protein